MEENIDKIMPLFADVNKELFLRSRQNNKNVYNFEILRGKINEFNSRRNAY